MASISRALSRIKQDLGAYLAEGAIETACLQAGHQWRERELGPVATVHLFVLQVLHFNTAMTHLRHLAGRAVNAAAYCRARMRLPLAALERLLRDSASAMRQALLSPAGECAGAGLWCGLRALLVDGSSTITPDTPQLQEAFKQPTGQKPGCGFPVPKVLGLFGSVEVEKNMAFQEAPAEWARLAARHPRLSIATIAGADHFYSGVRDAAWATIASWLASGSGLG